MPANETTEPTSQQKLDKPETTADLTVIESGGRVPTVKDLGDMPDDPWKGFYETDLYDKKGRPLKKALKRFEEAHDIDRWLELREQQRQRVLKAEERGAGQELTDVQKVEVLISHGLEPEDDRSGVVETVSKNLIIEPPVHPGVLEQLVQRNNTLSPMINAMEVNIDGTGFEIVPTDTQTMDDEIEAEVGRLDQEDEEFAVNRKAVEKDKRDEVQRQAEKLEGFFKEPWPGESGVTQRRKMRYDEESTGNAYMEVIRNLKGDIVLERHIDSKLMRMVRLDEPVVAPKEIERFGEKVTVNVAVRERRFVEQIGGGLVPRFQNSPTAGGAATTGFRRLRDGVNQDGGIDVVPLFSGQGTRLIYFKEFGASRDLDMWTGQWALPGERIPIERRATEILHFGVEKDARTPYFLPRWYNEIPAVLGSRKAEEFNLAFFDTGGIPPLLITVAGGQMAADTKTALEDRLNSQKAGTKHRAMILEVSATGRLDKQSKVQVDVQRFGSERTQDSLFQKYDERTSDLVRMSFRLPPVFLGDAEAHNFATMKASYLVAEAQVFAPERMEYDAIINLKLLREMPGGENFMYRSKPMVVKDAELQLKAIVLMVENALVPGEEIVGALNEITHLDVSFDEEGHNEAKEEKKRQAEAMTEVLNGQKPPQQEEEPEEPEEAEKKAIAKSEGLVALGIEWAECMRDGIRSPGARRRLSKTAKLLSALNPREMEFVRRVVAMHTFGSDDSGLQDLLGGCGAMLAASAEE